MGAAEDLMLLPPMLRAEGGGGGRGPKEVGCKKGKSVNLCTHTDPHIHRSTHCIIHLCGQMTGSFQELVASRLVEGGEVLSDRAVCSGRGWQTGFRC